MEWQFGVSVSVVRTGTDVGVRTHTCTWKQASMREVSIREQASLVSLKEALLPWSSSQSKKIKKIYPLKDFSTRGYRQGATIRS